MSRQASSTLVRWPKILLLGDSQTQYGFNEESSWVSKLASHFQRRCDVINRGFSGYNSRWLKEMIPKLIDEELAKECAAVTLFLGSNDANLKDINPQQHVPLEEYKSALMYMVHHLIKLGIRKECIILVAPPPVDEELWGKCKKLMGAELGLFNTNLVKYAGACCEVSSELNVACIDLFSEMMKHEDWKKYVNVDGLHLATEGGNLLAQLLLTKLDQICSDCCTKFPEWSSVNKDDPAESFQNVH
ncbi:IAH1 [Bugula neritina]|uniref:Isoamyl acetate-hydrolyzing esterase 1 homolog n=1 Tax=Bugula neritina TaxID=10212 RepID=A0A7J7KJ67_BUGNE|nr:IAH1 [Bugula neritina]